MRSQEKKKKKKKRSSRSRGADALISLLLAEHFRAPKNISPAGRQAGRKKQRWYLLCSRKHSSACQCLPPKQEAVPTALLSGSAPPPPPLLSLCLCLCSRALANLMRLWLHFFFSCCLASYRAQAHDIWQKHKAAKMKNERADVHVCCWREGGRETGGGGGWWRQMLLWYHTSNPHTHTHTLASLVHKLYG